MHIGRGEIDSKTECIYFPTPGWLAPDPTPTLSPPCAEIENISLTTISNQLSIEDSPAQNAVAVTAAKSPRQSDDSRKARCDAKYDACDKTERIVLGCEFVASRLTTDNFPSPAYAIVRRWPKKSRVCSPDAQQRWVMSTIICQPHLLGSFHGNSWNYLSVVGEG